MFLPLDFWSETATSLPHCKNLPHPIHATLLESRLLGPVQQEINYANLLYTWFLSSLSLWILTPYIISSNWLKLSFFIWKKKWGLNKIISEILSNFSYKEFLCEKESKEEMSRQERSVNETGGKIPFKLGSGHCFSSDFPPGLYYHI